MIEDDANSADTQVEHQPIHWLAAVICVNMGLSIMLIKNSDILHGFLSDQGGLI